MEWYNEAPAWNVVGTTITVTAGPRTDFWRKTHYGFIRDTGHFFYQDVTGDFVANVKVSGAYATLYDQAGLMVRVDEANWLKCGIEYVDGVQYASAVVTRDYSDWSVVPLRHNPPHIWLRIKRENTTLEVSYSFDNTDYTMLRQTYLPLPEAVQIGPMCAAPEGNGFAVTFEHFEVASSVE